MSLILVLFAQRDGEVISSTKPVYPKYEDVKGISVYCDKKSYDEAIADKSVSVAKVEYYSDGLRVVAYFAASAHITAGKKYPVIIFNRGGFIRNDIAFVYAPFFRKLVKEGFVMVAPALRQSEGSEGKDEVGGNDLHDVWNVLPIVSSKRYIDTANIFMFGESRGGVMTFELIRDHFPLRAAVTVGAFADFASYIKENEGIEKLNKQIWSNYKAAKDSIIFNRSAILWAEKLSIPLLLMGGTADASVNPHHLLALGDRLSSLHKDYQLIQLNNGNHILSGKWTGKRDAEAITWFRQHLKQ